MDYYPSNTIRWDTLFVKEKSQQGKNFARIAYIAGIGAYVMLPFGAHVTAIDSSGRRA
jgi:hypothetical protein